MWPGASAAAGIRYIEKTTYTQQKSCKGMDAMEPVKPEFDAPPPTGGKTYDPLLDPLPQPEVVESDTDTAWALWQDVLSTEDHAAAPEPEAPTFADTVPMGLVDLPPLRKP